MYIYLKNTQEFVFRDFACDSKTARFDVVLSDFYTEDQFFKVKYLIKEKFRNCCKI